MKQEIKLIYTGILQFGFNNKDQISIIGLIDYILRNGLKTDEEPEINLNKSYIFNEDQWFWEIEWNNDLISERRCLVVWFDKEGCHFQKFSRASNESPPFIEGVITKYDDFLNHFKWLDGESNKK